MMLFRRVTAFFFILTVSLFACIQLAHSADDAAEFRPKNKESSPLVIDEDFDPDAEDLKKLPVTFDMGGSVFAVSRVLFNTFGLTDMGTFNNAKMTGFEPVPNDQWFAAADGRVWMKMNIEKESFIHLAVRALFKFEQKSIVPMFNIDDLYIRWKYPIGKVIIGRTTYNLRSAYIFSGPLDGMQLDINIPFLNFKTFVGFTGLLGLFNPWFNPYCITSRDRMYYEDTNLLFGTMLVKFNSDQARRIFFATDFDIHFFGQHINPYFLMQYDMQSLFSNLNTEYDVHTFHLGLNFDGRIIQNLYYGLNVAGLFGTHPASTKGVVTPIVGCAFDANLRYTVAPAGHSTFVLGYAVGTGNKQRAGAWSDYPSDRKKGFWSDKFDGAQNNKFFYYGKFDGGYVLRPVLSNLQVISFKYIVSPISKGATHWTIYAGFYQTFKIWATGSISDDLADLEQAVVGSEIDAGMLINAGPYFTIGMDFGVFIPQSAYSDKSPRFRMGASVGFSF